jgi:hypothetical protein
MNTLLHGWPFAGLALSVVLFVRAWRAPRSASATSRWSDPAFVVQLLWPMYLLHQFEEHGIDALGRHFSFLGSLCATIGHASVDTCPADAQFVFAVNVIACPMAFSLPMIWARTRPHRAVLGWSVPLSNALAHIVPAVLHREYDPGLLTSVVLFVPLGLWMLRLMLRAGAIRPAQIPLLFVAGGLMHAVLLGSLLGQDYGFFGHTTVLAINAVNGLIPWCFALWTSSRSRLALGAVPPTHAALAGK